MLTVAVDPYLIALPNPCNSADDLEQFINNLLAWSNALNRDDLLVLVPELSLEALLEDELYPYDHQLINLWRIHLADTEIPADEETVCQLIRGILAKTPTLEQHINIEDIIYDEDNTIITPVDFLDRLNAKSAAALQKGLTMLGLWYQNSIASSGASGCVFAAGLGENIKQHNELIIASEVTFVEPRQCDLPPYYQAPSTVEGSFHICFGYADVLQQIGCLNLWGEADSEPNAVDAINLRTQELVEVPSTNRNILSFQLGSRFLGSARERDFTRSDLAMILIDSCARILVQTPKNSLEHFRVDKRPQSAQLCRQADGALAWRTHLTKHGAGFRLMFWQLTDNSIEFANVGSKFEFEIYE